MLGDATDRLASTGMEGVGHPHCVAMGMMPWEVSGSFSSNCTASRKSTHDLCLDGSLLNHACTAATTIIVARGLSCPTIPIVYYTNSTSPTSC